MLDETCRPVPPGPGCAALAAPSYAQPAAFGGPKMLIHGNYCGPGNNAPLPPIDALDAACARHDACTPEGGLPTPACNLRLQQEAALIARDPRQTRGPALDGRPRRGHRDPDPVRAGPAADAGLGADRPGPVPPDAPVRTPGLRPTWTRVGDAPDAE